MYAAELKSAISAVTKAFRVCTAVQDRLLSGNSTITKGDKSPVTVGDYAVQAIIINELLQTFPSYPFIAEEESKTLKETPDILAKVLACVGDVDKSFNEDKLLSVLDQGATMKTQGGLWWTLDPIDGTSGFIRKDQYAIALALMDENHKPVVGVLGCPSLRGDLNDAESTVGCILYASKGQGAFQMNGDGQDVRQLNVSQLADPTTACTTESFVVRGYARELNEKITQGLGIKRESLKIDSQCKYAVVARGDSDIYLRLSDLSYKECIWDHGAGVCVVEEAGGVVSDFLGNPLDFSAGRKLVNNYGIVCTNKLLYPAVMTAIKELNPLGVYDLPEMKTK